VCACPLLIVLSLSLSTLRCAGRNGTYLDPLTTTDLDMDSGFDLVYAMRGAPPLKTYEKFTDLKWWGYSTPKEYTGASSFLSAFFFCLS
jgi:hypothetical protein